VGPCLARDTSQYHNLNEKAATRRLGSVARLKTVKWASGTGRGPSMGDNEVGHEEKETSRSECATLAYSPACRGQAP
jgi:hypothetical protein